MEILGNTKENELSMEDLILAQIPQDQEIADALLKTELIGLGIKEEKASLYMLGQVGLKGDESETLKRAQAIVVRGQVAKVALDAAQTTVVYDEQVAA